MAGVAPDVVGATQRTRAPSNLLLMPNLRLAFRTLSRAPVVAIGAITSLALGIGANAAIFSLFNEILLKPLPVPAPYDLVNLSAPGPKPGSQSCGNAGNCDVVFSYPMFRDLEQAQQVFTGIAAHRDLAANFAYRGQTVNGTAMMVSGSYFDVLRLTPALGRLVAPSDDSGPGEAAVVVLGHAFWRDSLGGDPSVINDSLIVNGTPMTIIGVAPASFRSTTLGVQPQAFVPITMRPVLDRNAGTILQDRRNYWVYLFARLRPGLILDQASASLNGYYGSVLAEVEAPLQTGMSAARLAEFRAKTVTVEPGAGGQTTADEASGPLSILLGATALVLLIACANVANLLLARSMTRAGEMAVRLSIGANRWHLVSQLLTEALVLALAGGVAGLLVAQWTLRFIVSMVPPGTSGQFPVDLDGNAMAYAALLTLTTAVMFGLFPALHASRPDLTGVLKGQSGQPSGARSAARLRRTLATVQIMLAMALLGVAGLFIKSLYNVSSVDLGLDPEHVITFTVSPELNGYEPQRSHDFFRRLEEALAGQPGVTQVSAARVPVLAGSSWGSDVSIQGVSFGPEDDRNSRFNEVGPGFFTTVGMTLVAGREFTDADTVGAARVAIVNERFAEKFGLDGNVVGRLMGSGAGRTLDTEIVGLVRDARYNEVRAEVPPLFIRPYKQNGSIGSMTFYARTAMDPEQAIGTIQPLVAQLDPNLPVEDLLTLPDQIAQNIFADRLVMTLSVWFAGLATALAAIGLYGVLSYTVAQRTREFGLRMALGAAPERVRVMVLRQVAWMALIGAALGVGLAAALGRVAESVLFELDGTDPVVLGLAVAVLAVVAMAAGFVPAHRASRINPMRALKYE